MTSNINGSSLALPGARDVKSSGEGGAETRYLLGKRNDGKGWDLIVLRGGGEHEVRGPFRLAREARAALLAYPKIDPLPSQPQDQQVPQPIREETK